MDVFYISFFSGRWRKGVYSFGSSVYYSETAWRDRSTLEQLPTTTFRQETTISKSDMTKQSQTRPDKRLKTNTCTLTLSNIFVVQFSHLVFGFPLSQLVLRTNMSLFGSSNTE